MKARDFYERSKCGAEYWGLLYNDAIALKKAGHALSKEHQEALIRHGRFKLSPEQQREFGKLQGDEYEPSA